VLTVFEHHANLLPWRELSKRHGFAIKYLPMSADGSIDLDVAKNIISSKTKVVAVTHASNVLGSLLPVKELGGLAKAAGAWMLVDAAQTVGRLSIDVKDLACDALAFSGHKLYGPEGIGVLYLSDALREVVKPLMYGGGMVEAVSDTAVTYAQDVRLLEAGSPNVSGAIGLAAACNFLTSIGLADIQRHERSLLELLMSALTALPGVTVLAGQPQFGRVGIVSVLVADVHPHDTAQVLADHGIAVRAGYHCAEPLVRCLHPSGTVRISLGLYNSAKDVEAVAVGLRAVTKLFV
jgi:cysteine desulfurase/selenocysteine lyase